MTYKFTTEKKSAVLELRKAVVEPCKFCKGSGYIPLESLPGSVRRCQCMIVFRYLMELIVSNIPSDYWHLSIDDLEIDKVYKDTVHTYVDNLSTAIQRGMGLAFMGPNGVGKTSLMCEVGKEAIVQGYQVRYFTLASYITAIQKNDDATLEDYDRGQVLLIDELDKKYQKRGSDFVIKALDESLRKFLAAGKTLVLCTNWNEGDIRENFGESTVSLLKRRCDFVEVVGEDYSEKLQGEFWDEIKKGPDYFCDNIMDMALYMEETRDE